MTWDDDSGAPKKSGVTSAPSAPTADLSPGTILSDTYEVEEHIALGGMAEVYRARNIHTDEPVAIKVILPEFARDEMRTALFLKEATVLSRLHHEAIVHYHMFTVEKETGRPYMVMEFVKGTPLSDRMKDGPLDAQSVKALIQRVAAGLSVAHEMGVVHRDLSPDNVVLPDGKVAKAKIIDFGIAKAIMADGGTLLGGKFAGKYNFVSPEQLGLFGGEISGQSDIYSLGLIAVAALRGEALDMSGSHAEVIEKRRQVPDLTGVDESIRPAIAAMLAPNPADRPASMQAVIDLLNAPPPKAAPAAADPWSDPQPKRDATVIAPRPPPPRPPTGGAGGLRRPPSSATVVTGAPVSATPQPQVESDSPFGAYVPPPGGASPFAAGPATGAAPPRPAQTPKPLPPYKPKRGGSGGLIALVIVVILLAGGGLFAFSQNWFGLLAQKPAITDTTVVASNTKDAAGKVETPPVDTTTTTVPETEAESGKSTLVPDDAAQQEAQQATTQPPVTTTTPTQQTASTEDSATADETTAPSGETTPKTTSPTATTTTTTTSPAGDTEVAINEPQVDITRIPPLAGVPALLAWVNAYELSSCEFAQALAADERSMSIETFGMNAQPFETMMNNFTAENGFEPEIGMRLVAEAQCPAVDFLRFVKALADAGPKLNVDGAGARSGTSLSGSLQAISGWQTDLLLVDDDGIVHNIGLTPAPSGSTASFTVRLDNPSSAPRPQLLLAISTRNGLVAPGSAEGLPATAVFPAILREIRQKNPNISVAVKYLKVAPG